jgi:aminoglycoside phosphotransferase (APT) family kinase protein
LRHVTFRRWSRSGGASSLTYVGRCADRPVVVKVAELATVYREELGSEVPQLDWFQALACFKSAATWSLIVKHNRRRNPPDPDLEVMAAALPQLLSRAGDLLG